jgi:hypothetical protein
MACNFSSFQRSSLNWRYVVQECTTTRQCPKGRSIYASGSGQSWLGITISVVLHQERCAKGNGLQLFPVFNAAPTIGDMLYNIAPQGSARKDDLSTRLVLDIVSLESKAAWYCTRNGGHWPMICNFPSFHCCTLHRRYVVQYCTTRHCSKERSVNTSGCGSSRLGITFCAVHRQDQHAWARAC